MNIAWLFSENTVLRPDIDLQKIKDIAPIWGSWRIQRGYHIDNAVCWNNEQAEKLIAQGYSKICNLFVHQSVYNQQKKPNTINVFDGEFGMPVDCPDDVIAAHLVESAADVVLMMGFDFEQRKKSSESRNNYISLMAQLIKSSQKQWVIIDHCTDLDHAFDKIANLTRDKLPNVLHLLS